MTERKADADGDSHSAQQWIRAIGDPERLEILPRLWADVSDEVQMARLALAVGDRELAESAVAAAERRAALNPDVRSIGAVAAQARGLLDRDVEQLSLAVSKFERTSRDLALAAAWEDLGTAQQQSATPDSGIDALSNALVLFSRIGASRDAARLRSRLRELGVRRRVTKTEKPTKGWVAMTKSELAVAELVAHGLTNREVAEQLFVSPHTVNTHLRRVFAKLQVNSRVDLTRLAAERGVDRA